MTLNIYYLGEVRDFDFLGQQYLEKVLEPGSSRLRSWVCRVCSRPCPDFYAGKMHLEIHFPSVGAYPCETCGKRFNKAKSYKDHKRRYDH